MSKNKKPAIIEIDDSTDDEDNDESTNTSDSNLPLAQCKRKSATSTTFTSATTSKQSNTSPLPTQSKKTTFNIDHELDNPNPRRVMNRRKSLHHSIRSTEDDISFELPARRKRRESLNDEVSMSKKKQRWDDSQIDDAVDKNIDDPEIEQVLKKIAYCRVFSNYLLRQYDMLAIDFKLYSNLDLLNLDLNMRVDTYTAIRKSRQRFKEARERNGQVQL